MADVLIDFNEGREIHTVQQARLGEIASDTIGNTWSYVEFREAVNIGEVVRDAEHTDLQVANPTVVTTDAPAGTNRLTASGAFASPRDDLRGAIGAIVGDGTGNEGEGQNFIVTDVIDDNTLEVRVLTALQSATVRTPIFVTDGNWHEALDASNNPRFRLAFPGAAHQGDGLADNVRGFAQVQVQASDIAGAKQAYAWVQQTGLGFVRLDASADPPAIGEGLVQAGAGLVKGFTTAGTTADEAAAVIAKSLLGDYGFAATNEDGLMWAELSVVNRAQSYRLPHETHPFARPGQRIV